MVSVSKFLVPKWCCFFEYIHYCSNTLFGRPNNDKKRSVVGTEMYWDKLSCKLGLNTFH